MTVPANPARRLHFAKAGCVIAIVAAVLLVHGSPALQAGYVHDDHAAVEQNPRVAWPPDLGAIFSGVYFGDLARFRDQALCRPLATLSFAAEIPLGLGSPVGRHGVQLALYALLCSLVFHLGFRLLVSVGVRPEEAIAGALAAALAFALHPGHAEVVMSIAYRPEILALLFVVLGTQHGVDLRLGLASRWRTPLVLGLAFAAALLSKESALAALGAWLAWLSAARVPLRRVVPAIAGLLLIAVAWLAWRRWNLGSLVAVSIPFADNPLAHEPAAVRLVQALDIAARAAAHLVWPFDLAPDYTFAAWPLSRGWTARGVAGAIGLASLTATAAFAWWRLRFHAAPVTSGPDPSPSGTQARTRPLELTLLCATWVLAFYLPVSHLLFPSTVVMADRLLFAPSLAWALGIGAAVAWATPRLRGWRVVPLAALVMAFLALLGLESRTTSRDWRSDLELYARGVRLQPRSVRMRHDLGYELLRQGRAAEAVGHARAAFALMPDDADVVALAIESHAKSQLCTEVAPYLAAASRSRAVLPRLAAVDLAFACGQFAEPWRLARALPSRKLSPAFQKRVFALGIAAGDRDGATALARTFTAEPWSQPAWVAAAVFGFETAGKPRDALEALAALARARPELSGLDRAARDLYQRHAAHAQAAELRALVDQAWPAGAGGSPPSPRASP